MTKMTKQDKNIKNFPNLRFPGFNGDWEIKKLGELTELITKGTTPKKFVNKGVKFIKIECFDGNMIDPERCLFIDEEIHNKELKRSILKENDLLFAIAGATIGKVNFVNNEILPANTNQALAIIRLKKTENSKFVYQILKSDIMHRYIKDSISVGAQPNLNLQQMNEFSFFYPSISEQHKIGSFLYPIDERIATQKKMISHLKTSIRSFREKIFSQKLRFKDELGNNFPDWEESKLESICQKQSSNISANKIEENFGSYTIYGASGILKKVDFYEEENEFISIVKDGAGVGRLFLCEAKSSVLGTMDIIKSKSDVNTYFLFYQLSNIDFTKYVTGSTIPHIYFKDYKKEKLKIPSSDEQTKIANFLASIDEKIETEKKILEQYENQKKYLLTNLFV